MLRQLALAVAVPCVLLASVVVCDAAIVSAGERVRFVGPGRQPTEATVLAAAGDTIVVSYDALFYPPRKSQVDTLRLGSLEWLEVRLRPASVLPAMLFGATLGASIAYQPPIL